MDLWLFPVNWSRQFPLSSFWTKGCRLMLRQNYIEIQVTWLKGSIHWNFLFGGRAFENSYSILGKI